MQDPPKQSTGLAVAFVGCDGSGKSTVTKVIEDWLRENHEVERVYPEFPRIERPRTWDTHLPSLPKNLVDILEAHG